MTGNRIHSIFLAMVILLLVTGISVAGPLDKVRFIKVAPQDEKAVIMGPDGKLRVIKKGDTVADNITVKEIIPGRIILEENTAKGPETVIVRVENGRQRIERIRKQAEGQEVKGAVLDMGQKQDVLPVPAPNNGTTYGKTSTDKAQGGCSSCGANKK